MENSNCREVDGVDGDLSLTGFDVGNASEACSGNESDFGSCSCALHVTLAW